MIIEDYASLELAKQLKKIGFNEPCDYSYTVYTSDFIYDGDPDHPESHKKGDIRIYDFYNENSGNRKNTYSMPHLYDVQKWFRERNIIITPELEIDDEQRGWTVSIAHLESGASQYNPKKLEKYEDALLKGCLDAVRWYIKPNKTDSNKE